MQVNSMSALLMPPQSRGNLKMENCQEKFTLISLAATRAGQGTVRAHVHNPCPGEMVASLVCT